MAVLTDEQLARLACAGDRPAFGELIRRHAPSVRVLLRRMGAPSPLADDIAQDACLKAFERIATFRHEGPFAAWLKRIAARLYIRRWQRHGRFDAATDSFESTSVVDMAARATPLEAMDLDQALMVLNEAERMCITLCVGAGLTHTEAAEELCMPIGTVKSHVHRGLGKMRTWFESSTGGSTRVRA